MYNLIWSIVAGIVFFIFSGVIIFYSPIENDSGVYIGRILFSIAMFFFMYFGMYFGLKLFNKKSEEIEEIIEEKRRCCENL